MVDIIARGMAANNSGGGGGDSYTKAETDALLSKKQNLITLISKLSSDLVDFNLTEEDVIRLFNEVKAEDQTEVEVNGNNIKFLTDTTTEGDDTKIETGSTFAYKDKIHL